MAHLHENALHILQVMYDNSITQPKSEKSIQEIANLASLSSDDFDEALNYLLTSKYVTGAGGGPAAKRWLTNSGIDFLTQQKQLSDLKFNISDNQIAIHTGSGPITLIKTGDVQIEIVIDQLKQWFVEQNALDEELASLFHEAEKEPTERNLRRLLSNVALKAFDVVADASAAAGLNLLLQLLLNIK